MIRAPFPCNAAVHRTCHAAIALLLCAALPAHANTPVAQLPALSIAAPALPFADYRKPGPLRYAVAVPAAAGLTQGLWESDAGGHAVWRLRVHAPEASSISLTLRGFHMPAGGALYFSALDGSHRRGPYGAEHNGAGQLWTALVPGSDALIEADVPAGMKDELALQIAQVHYGFLPFWKAGATDKSGSCNIDVVCPQGDAWRDEIRSVARYTIAGQYLCSGQLLNDTGGDFTPHFLTANHCLSSEADAESTVFYWNYQTSTCGGTPDGNLDQNQSGATLEASYAPSDFTLLKLDAAPSGSFNVYYAGWDAANAAPSDGVVTIHHPGGDEKRISMSSGPTDVESYGGGGDDGTHLRVQRWDEGTTEGGSSGAGLWNSAHHVVGQLHGGAASCDNTSGSDWFGRFAVSWTGGGSATDSLAPNLDAGKSSLTVMDGADPNGKSTPLSSAAPSNASAARYGGALGFTTLLPLWWMRRRRRS